MSILSKDRPRQSVLMPAEAVKTKHPEGDWHALTKDEVLLKLETHEAGLSNDEVIQRRENMVLTNSMRYPPSLNGFVS